MRVALLLLLAVGLVHTAPAQEAAGAADTAVTAQAYVKSMVSYMGNPDPRLRYSVREALRVMGPQAISAINEAMATETNKHVKAFMARTVEVIKSTTRERAQADQPDQPGARGPGAFAARALEVDIDRVAMEANLTWEQMDEVLPILKKARKDMTDLMAEFRNSGGNFRDQDAMRDLREEMNAIVKDAETKAKKMLSEAQIQQIRRYLNPMGPRMDGGRFGGEGGRRGGRGEGRGEGRGGGGGDSPDR